MLAKEKARKAGKKSFTYKKKTYSKFSTISKRSGAKLEFYAEVNANGKRVIKDKKAKKSKKSKK